MPLGTSLFLIALGAILRFAVNVTTSGFSIHTIGIILIVIGLLGALISALWMTTWSHRYTGRERVVHAVEPEYRVPRDPDLV